ncbi:MAG: Holliday junction branch migration protein RuvA [Patescibacteria group bacterium]
MIYSVSGKIVVKKPQFAVIEANGIGFKIFISLKTFRQLPKINSKIRLFCYTNIRQQEGLELYGFLKTDDLEIFEILNTINGIGPKIALKVINAIKTENFSSIINEGRADLLIKSAGLGKKTAHRIILELTGKIRAKQNEEVLTMVETDEDIEKVLKNLGYKHVEIKDTIRQIPAKIKKIEERLKVALKLLSKR